VFRLFASVAIPGASHAALTQLFNSQPLLGLLDLFSGGGLSTFSLVAMGMNPFINATIIMQLMTVISERIKEISKEGEMGRRRITRWSRYLTVALGAGQAYGFTVLFQNTSPAILPALDWFPRLEIIMTLTAGTVMLMWFGELITEYGIGNGVSLIIFAGIVAGLPGLLASAGISGSTTGISRLILLVVIVVGLILAIVYFQEAERRVPVQYAKSVFRGGRMYRQSGQSFIPLKVNAAGMIPLLFAFSIMIFPGIGANYFRNSASGAIRSIASALQTAFDPRGGVYEIFVFILVVGFTFFYTMVIFQQQNLSENLQKQGGFIPGIRPGRPTHDYVTRVVTRITWAGALFLGAVSVVPYIATRFTGATQFTISATALLNLWNLGINGWANTYYSATVRSMSTNWHDFLYVSLDKTGLMTLDKPPLSLWIQALSARIFGFHPLSILIPQALMGIVAVVLVYDLVRRRFGRVAGSVAGFVLATTPTAVAVARHNNPDELLVLCCVAALWFAVRACEDRVQGGDQLDAPVGDLLVLEHEHRRAAGVRPGDHVERIHADRVVGSHQWGWAQELLPVRLGRSCVKRVIVRFTSTA